jgi:hypothetical protein
MIKKNFHTGVRVLGYDLIIQRMSKPFEIRVSINSNRLKKKTPREEEINVIINYLGEEGFLEYEGLSYTEYTDNPRIQIGLLNPMKFRNLLRFINHNE